MRNAILIMRTVFNLEVLVQYLLSLLEEHLQEEEGEPFKASFHEIRLNIGKLILRSEKLFQSRSVQESVSQHDFWEILYHTTFT